MNETQADWVDVQDRLPDHDKQVLIYLPKADPENPCYKLACYDHKNKAWWPDLPRPLINSVTHWARLPDPPQVSTS